MYLKIHPLISLILLVACPWQLRAQQLITQAPSLLFDDSIAPLLERNCVACHNAEKKEGGLALDTRAGLLAGGDSGPVIDADKPESSALLLAVLPVGNDDLPCLKLAMPSPSRRSMRSAGGSGRKHLGQRARQLTANEQPPERWWSLEPLTDHIPPTVQGHTSSSVVDAFIDHKIE